MPKFVAAGLLGAALAGLAMPAVAQVPSVERYPACQQAVAAEDRRIVDICELVDDLQELLGAYRPRSRWQNFGRALQGWNGPGGVGGQALRDEDRERRDQLAHRQRIAELNFSLSSALFALGFHGNDDLALADSIEAGRAAATYYDTDRERFRWASLQLQIAGALNERARRGGDAYAREGAEASRAGIAAVSRSQDPELWGALHNALANALIHLGRGGDRASLEEAAATLRMALEAYRGPRHAAERETTQRNLDRVLRMLGEANGT